MHLVLVISHEEGFVSLKNQLHDAMSGADIDNNLTGFMNLMDNICDPLFARQFKRKYYFCLCAYC